MEEKRGKKLDERGKRFDERVDQGLDEEGEQGLMRKENKVGCEKKKVR